MRNIWAAGAVVALLLATGASGAERGRVAFQEDFQHGLGERWVERGFPSVARKNSFSIVSGVDGNRFFAVHSDDSSSARGVHVRVSPERCPEISWRWRVSDVVAAADIRTRSGDDGAAKLYVIFEGPSWWNPFDKRVLVYVWDNAAPPGTVMPNAWRPREARMVVLRSGRANVDRWMRERVNLMEDFSRGFPAETPGTIEAVAFVTDTDNTHSRVAAGFDDLVIRCVSQNGQRPGG